MMLQHSLGTLLCDHTTEMRGDTREPQKILSQTDEEPSVATECLHSVMTEVKVGHLCQDVHSPGNTAVFLLPVVETGNGKGRTQGPRRTACPEGPRHLRRKPPRVRLPEDAGRTQ